MPINRRDLLTGTALTAAAGSLPVAAASTAHGAEHGKPAGIFSYAVGDITCTALNDGAASFPLGEGFVVNAELAEVQKAWTRALNPSDTMTIPFTAMAVDTGSRLVMLDTGTGGKMAPTAGTMGANMAAAGIDPNDVDVVAISHFHPDHINGLTAKDGARVYPNAEVVVPMAEWLYWTDDGAEERAPDALKPRFAAVRETFAAFRDELRLIGDGDEIVPGIMAKSAHGHTPGHTLFHIASGDDQMMVLGDLTNHPALFVRHPDWASRFDMDAQMAAQTRRAILDLVAVEDILVAGYHFPFPATGHVVKDGSGFALELAAWQPQL